MKIGKYSALVCGTTLFILLFIFRDEFFTGAAIGLSNCAQVIVPSLFPFMTAASILGESELPEWLKKLIEPLTRRVFHQPAESAIAIAVGLLGGYPSGTKAAVSLCKSGRISESQAKSLMLFCVNPGTGFCVNAIGVSLLGSEKSGIIIFASLCISAVLTGLVVRAPKEDSVCTVRVIAKNPSGIFVESVASGASGIIGVCAFTTLFSGVISVISSSGVSEKTATAIACILEITSGCAAASGKISLPLLTGVCAFGGLCVHMQIFSVAGELKPDYKKFFLCRAVHSVLSVVVCTLLLKLFPVEEPTFLSVSENVSLCSFSVPAAISLLFFSSLLIFDLDKQRKIC
ncbi:MAG: hypothetical protein J6R20_03975 [Clostridia bacterium]|nr:hypothetical protein [Clostridia bacterium]